MSILTSTELAERSHDQIVWEAGIREGRDSVRLCMTYEEILAESPYLVDGQDPTDLMLKRIAEIEQIIEKETT